MRVREAYQVRKPSGEVLREFPTKEQAWAYAKLVQLPTETLRVIPVTYTRR